MFLSGSDREVAVEPLNKSQGKKQHRILVVDDERINRFLTSRVLEKAGHSAITAENGSEAIKRYKENEFSVVVLDFQMPVMNGMDALKELIKIDPEVKVIVCSAYSGDRGSEDFIKEGAKAFILKPFDISTIRDTIDKLIGDV